MFCSFLALVLRKELEDRLAAARLKPEWRELLADLDRLQEIEAEQDGKRFILRTPVTGVAGSFPGGRRRTAAQYPRRGTRTRRGLIAPPPPRQRSAKTLPRAATY